MKNLAIALVVLCGLTIGAAAVAAQGNPLEIPPVKVACTADSLVLTFPENTLPYTVGLKAHGMVLTQKMIRHHHKDIVWSSPTELSINLKAFHHKKHMDAKPTDMWVWGQLKSGEALMQKQVVQ